MHEGEQGFHSRYQQTKEVLANPYHSTWPNRFFPRRVQLIQVQGFRYRASQLYHAAANADSQPGRQWEGSLTDFMSWCHYVYESTLIKTFVDVHLVQELV